MCIRDRYYGVFLGIRPNEKNRVNTGRETFILPVDWSGTCLLYTSSFVRGGDDMGRYDRAIRNVGYLFLYVYNVPHAVLIGAKRTGESDKERFGISGNGYCRQCLPATVDGLFHACQ